MEKDNVLGIFCGFAQTISEQKPFIKNDIINIRKIFKHKQAELIRNSFISSESKYYSPFIFYTFGEYDYFILSIVSDLNFPARYFREFYFDKCEIEGNFNLQNKYSYFGIIEDLIDKELYNNLLSYSNKHSIIGIIHLKMNIIVIRELRFVINTILSKHLKNIFPNDFEFVSISSFSWNECTLLIFSNGFEKINGIVEYLLDLSIVKLTIDESIKNYFTNIGQLFAEEKVVIRTETIYGFNSILIDNVSGSNNNDLTNIVNEDKVFTYLNGVIQGNEPIEIANQLNKENSSSFWIPGRLDLMILNKINKEKVKEHALIETNSRDLIEHTINIVESSYLNNIKFETILLFSLKQRVDSKEPTSKKNEIVRYDLITREEIIQLESSLKNLMIPTPLRDAIVNLIYIINRNIQDPVMQLNYIGMIEAVRNNINYILNIEKNKSKKGFTYYSYYDYIVNLSYSIKTGIENRLQSSYYTRNFAETYTLFQGSIQIPINCFEMLLKNYLEYFGLSKSVIVCVDSRESISISETFLRLNYYHIYQPENLLSILCCEVSQDLISKYDSEKNNIFKYCEDVINERGVEVLDDEIAEYLESNMQSTTEYINRFNQYLSLIPKDYFNHIIGDIYNYKIVYNDIRLFSFWYWVNFLITPYVYDKKDIINITQFIRRLIRYRIVLKIINSEEDYDWIKLFKEVETKYLYFYNVEIGEYVEFLMGMPEFNKWILETRKYVISNCKQLEDSNKQIKVLFDDINNILINIFSKYNENENYFKLSPFGSIIPAEIEGSKFLLSQRLNLYRKLYPLSLDSLFR